MQSLDANHLRIVLIGLDIDLFSWSDAKRSLVVLSESHNGAQD